MNHHADRSSHLTNSTARTEGTPVAQSRLSVDLPRDGTEMPLWHTQTVGEVASYWHTDVERGLSAEEVERRQKKYGPNELTQRRGRGPLLTFLLQFHQPLIYILLAATVVTMGLGEYLDAAVIFGVVLVNAIVGFVQEYRATRAIEALARSIPTLATVVRQGRKERVSATTLVPGDVVLLQSGDRVPADLRLVRVRELRVAEAALTGESVPVDKQAEPLPAETVLADRTNMAFASSLVTYGQGVGIVVAIGQNTEVGRIAQAVASAEEIVTPLTRRIAHFSRVLLVVILTLAAVNFLVGVLRGLAAGEMFLASVALAVAAIPEGLPAAVTIMLAIGVSRMAARHAVIRKLPAVETLGSTTVICSDKTGTLTQNQMTVTRLLAGDESFAIQGVGYEPKGEIHTLGDIGLQEGREQEGREAGGKHAGLSIEDLHGRVALLECLRAGVLCNDAVLVEESGRFDIQGDPTEGALLVVARKAGLDPHVLQEELPRLDVLPFESERQYMATLHDTGPDRHRLIYVKGSLERVLEHCSGMWDRYGHEQPLQREAILVQATAWSAQGLRILAVARKLAPADQALLQHEDVQHGLTFLGLFAMIDPPRPEAIQAVRLAQEAGILVKMITGDHALTASAIAEQLGLHGVRDGATGRLRAITGAELARTTEAELPAVAEEVAVFARTAPEQKLRLVRALQSRGHIVAMTGDGINDAPALKQADIGIAMGLSGTDAAREAADMVLTDDNFATIEAAIEEGRGVFDNLVKFIVWTLPTNFGEGLILMAAILIGSSLPVLPIQVLWINMSTALLLGLMLVFEPKEPNIMRRPPRHPHAPLLNYPLVMRTALVSGLILLGGYGVFEWLLLVREAPVELARSAVVNVVVFVELFYLFNCRCLTHSMFHVGWTSNPWVWFGVTAMTLCQILLTHVSPLNTLFHMAPLPLEVWVAIVGYGLMVYGIIEVEKAFIGPQLFGPVWTPGRSLNPSQA